MNNKNGLIADAVIFQNIKFTPQSTCLLSACIIYAYLFTQSILIWFPDDRFDIDFS